MDNFNDDFLEHLSYLQATALISGVDKVNDIDNYDEDNKFNAAVLTDDEKEALELFGVDYDSHEKRR